MTLKNFRVSHSRLRNVSPGEEREPRRKKKRGDEDEDEDEDEVDPILYASFLREENSEKKFPRAVGNLHCSINESFPLPSPPRVVQFNETRAPN